MSQRDVSVDDDSEIDLLELFSVLWGNKWKIFGVTFLAVLLGLAYYLSAERVYKANALVQVETTNQDLALPTSLQDLMPSQNPEIETETGIMTSRMVVGKVVRDLHLDWVVTPWRLPGIGRLLERLKVPPIESGFLAQYAWKKASLTLAQLDVAPSEVGAPITVSVISDQTFDVTWADGLVQKGKVGTPIVNPKDGSRLTIQVIDATPGRKFTVVQQSVPNATQVLQNALSASQPNMKSNLISSTFTSTSPQEAERVLEAISKAFVAQNVARSSAEANKSLEFVQNQLPKVAKQVTDAQAALNKYQQTTSSVDLPFETQSLLTQQADIETQLNQLALKADELKTNYTRQHPLFVQLEAQKQQLLKQLADLQKKTAGLPETQKQMFDLTRNLQLAQTAYESLLSRAQALQIMSASSIGNVRIIDNALASPKPISPKGSLILALAAILGLMFGSALVLLRHVLRRGVRGAEDIEKLGLPVFATLSYSDHAAKVVRKGGGISILALEHSDDPVVEAIRSLRTSLHFGMLDATSKTIMLTSTSPAAGKSFTSVNLAVVMAQSGQKVCLVDADMRRGYLRRYMGVARGTPGLAEYLAGDKTLDEVLIEGPVEGLSFIPTGRMPPNPSELLMRKQMTKLVEELDARFDMSLLDAPPTLAVTDPVILGKQAGSSIVIVRHMETAVEELAAVNKIFSNAGIRLSGAVLNAYRAQPGQYKNASYHYNYRYNYVSRGD